jgi:hypothetical protein
MGDWDVVSHEEAKPPGDWDVVSHEATTPSKSIGDRLSYAWENATPGGPLWMARQAIRGVKGAVEGSEAAVAPQVGSDEEEQQRQIVQETGPASALQAMTVMPNAPIARGGLGPVGRVAADFEAQAAEKAAARTAAATPPPLPPQAPSPQAPQQVIRPDAGVDLLHPNVPHALPTFSEAGPAAAAGPLSHVSPETMDWLKGLFSDYNQNTIDQRLDEMSAHQFLGEVNPRTEQHMRAIASRDGPGRNEVVGSVRQRALEKPERLRGIFNRAFGENEDVSRLRRLVEGDRDQAASPLYQRFRQTPIQPSPQIDAMLPRLRAAGALQAANKALAEEGLPSTHGFVEGPAENAFDEGQEVTRVPTAAAFDYAKQHLDRLITSAVENSDANSARRYTQMKNDLDAALDAHPTAGRLWQQARQAYAGPTQRLEAMRFGQRILTNNVDADELPFLTNNFSDQQMQGARVGLRKYLEDTIGGRREVSADIFNKTLSPNNVAKIRWFIGDQATDEMIHAMEGEYHMHGAPNRIFGNSQTEFTRQANESLKAKPQENEFGLSDLTSPIKTGFKFAEKAARKALASKREAAENERIARMTREAAPLFTLQGPQRDAVARYLVGGVQPYAKGGAVKSKRSKASVDYRHATGKERCKTCSHSYGPDGDRKCHLVVGRIFPDDTCNLFEAKSGYAHGGAVHNSHPTEAQKKAGNYAKTHKHFQGLDITIENLKGSNRSGIGKDGKSWSVRMPAHYGYIKRTEGADGDHVDFYLGPNEKSDQVFVVDQKDYETGRFDEHKCLMGFSSESEAKRTYLAGFSDGKNRIKHMRRMSMAEFRNWLDKGDTTKQIKHFAFGGGVNRAIRASKGYEDGGSPQLSDDDQAAMSPETYANPVVDRLIRNTANTLAVPGRVYNSPRPVSTEEMVGPAADLAGLVTLGAGAMPAEDSLRMGIKAYHGSPF